MQYALAGALLKLHPACAAFGGADSRAGGSAAARAANAGVDSRESSESTLCGSEIGASVIAASPPANLGLDSSATSADGGAASALPTSFGSSSLSLTPLTRPLVHRSLGIDALLSRNRIESDQRKRKGSSGPHPSGGPELSVGFIDSCTRPCTRARQARDEVVESACIEACEVLLLRHRRHDSENGAESLDASSESLCASLFASLVASFFASFPPRKSERATSVLDRDAGADVSVPVFFGELGSA